MCKRPKLAEDFVSRIRTIELDTAKERSLHAVNTSVIRTASMTVQHLEGGWPENIDVTEKATWLASSKKAEKDDDYKLVVGSGARIEKTAMMNNTIDIYEEYFEGSVADHAVPEAPSCKTLAVFRDPAQHERQTSSIDFHPEGAMRAAVTYAVLQFQDPRFLESVVDPAAIIHLGPHEPELAALTLQPPSPMLCLRYNKKQDWMLVGGCYNGMICCFDLRDNSSKPVGVSAVETLHLGVRLLLDAVQVELRVRLRLHRRHHEVPGRAPARSLPR